jgi:hypothetical protein
MAKPVSVVLGILALLLVLRFTLFAESGPAIWPIAVILIGTGAMTWKALRKR